MTDADNAPADEAQAEEAVRPGLRVVTQFIRDLSFENPKAPDSMRTEKGSPQMELGVELSARNRDDGLFEVDLKLAATARRGEEVAFHCELVYGGLFQIHGVPAEHLEQVLLTECPRFLFPFARRVVADLVSEGGFPPLMLDPLDFNAIYAARQAQAVGNA